MLAVLVSAAGAAAIVAGLLLLKSVKDYSHSGPQIRHVIARYYRLYSVFALARLWVAAWIVCTVLALPGMVLYLGISLGLGLTPEREFLFVAGLLSIAVCAAYRFCACLLYEPGVLAANSHYRMSRFHGLWRRLTPRRLGAALVAFWGALTSVVIWALGAAPAAAGEDWRPVLLLAFGLLLASRWLARANGPGARRVVPATAAGGAPNIVLIGCDTLRADRVVPGEYHRALTPHIARLIARGQLYTSCYVPVARTAPSLASLLTGCWPHRHGIRDNFVPIDALARDVPRLPATLRAHGYHTAAVADWAGSDLGKFDFGFDDLDVPDDQWNMKYLIRQGPKDLRLFLILFSHNRLGKRLLPEIFYVAGRPLSGDIGAQTMAEIDRGLARQKPFFVNAFMASGHPPFSAEYPYYLKYANPAYMGESKFAMAKLTDPMEIIRSQQEPREAFDLEQIVDLYDGCISRFDHEVGRIVDHLARRGVLDRTIVVIYSDHGMEFFEHGTWGQGNSALGDFSARVPLVICGPGITAQPPHAGVIRSIDLAPTLLDLADIPAPPGMDGQSFRDGAGSGRPVTAYFETGIWLTQPPSAPPSHLSYPDLLKILDVPDPVTGTLAVKPEFAGIVLRARDRLVRRGDWALMYQPLEAGAVYRLFHLREDPTCKRDRSGDHPELVHSLKLELERFLVADAVQPAALQNA